MMTDPETLLSTLITADGPASSAWLTRVHAELQRLYPDRHVCRFAEAVRRVEAWLKARGIQPDIDRLHGCTYFYEDHDGAQTLAEGGTLAFAWEGHDYLLVGVVAPRRRTTDATSWLIAADRCAAERLMDAVGRHQRQARSRVMVFESGEWADAPRLESDLTAYTWDSIVLPAPARDRLRRATETFFCSGDVYRDLGIPWKLGYLLVGPPGTGKTLATKVLAGTMDVPFLYVRGLSSFYDGAPDPSTVRDVFQGARDRAPCILCLEDVDSLVREDLRSTFLNQLDGIEEDYRGVLTVATTNHPEVLDAALLHRPSRFDYRFEFPLPDDAQRLAFLLHWTARLAKLGYIESPEPELEEVVRRSRGMSHAYLKRLMVATVLRMHTEELRGERAFQSLVSEELADALADRGIARRAEVALPAGMGGGVGFRQE